MKHITLKSLLLMVSVLAFTPSCNQEAQVAYKDEGTPIAAQPTAPARRTFSYDASLQSDVTALSLANASAFTMTLSDCASTQTATVTEADIYLELYEFDRNCVVKLTQFTLNLKVYTPKAGNLFTTWAAGDTAVFEVFGASPVDELNVKVLTTVGNPVVAGGSIDYRFSEITLGGDVTIGESVVRESQTIAVIGQAAPEFNVRQIKLVDITATGNGEFQFQLECKRNVVGTGATAECYDVIINDLRLLLIEDTFSGTMTRQNLDDAFTNGGGGVQINTATNVIAPGGGTPALPKGGFLTAAHGETGVLVMAGTKPIVQKPNMLLLLKADQSYLYFNVDVTLIVQNASPP